jgi:magnesium-transporting ATPase (P-type)
LALVLASARLGYIFADKSNDFIFTNFAHTHEQLTWEVLAEIPFNSTRKRMSLIIKNPRTE